MKNHTNNGSSDGFETVWRTLSKANATAPQATKPKIANTGTLTLGPNSISFLAFLTGFFVFLRTFAFLEFFFDGFAFFAAFLLAFAAFFAFAAAAFFAFAAFFASAFFAFAAIFAFDFAAFFAFTAAFAAATFLVFAAFAAFAFSFLADF